MNTTELTRLISLGAGIHLIPIGVRSRNNNHPIGSIMTLIISQGTDSKLVTTDQRSQPLLAQSLLLSALSVAIETEPEDTDTIAPLDEQNDTNAALMATSIYMLQANTFKDFNLMTLSSVTKLSSIIAAISSS